jgi:ABC-type antimicrobial peptide transport system permease subunit
MTAWNTYANLDALVAALKKEFKNKVIPGQPTMKTGKPYKQIYYSKILVEAESMNDVTALQKTISDMGYNAYSDAEWIAQEQNSMNMIQAVLGGIGAVSLLVAAIGIANTMMMSIYERTKEIGIMKVLGCDMRNIRSMFLMEAGYIGFFGGAAGIGFSYLLSLIINKASEGSDGGAGLGLGFGGGGGTISIIPAWLAGLSLVFAILIGMLAGFFPARRAMKLSALAAIKNE